MSCNCQGEAVPKEVFIGTMQQLADKLMPKRGLPEGVPGEDFKKLFETVCNFMKEHDLTVSEASNVLWHLAGTESERVIMTFPLGHLGKYPGCRCRWRSLDENGECWARCDRRVESCEVCYSGGKKGTGRAPAGSKEHKKRRKGC